MDDKAVIIKLINKLNMRICRMEARLKGIEKHLFGRSSKR